MWGDIPQLPESTMEDDAGYVALLNLLPADRQEMAGPFLRGLLANVKAQLAPDMYAVYCTHLRQAWEAHQRGDAATARTILTQYGIPYDMLAAAAE